MTVMNVTGPEMYSTKKVAKKFGEYFGKEPLFEGEEENSAYIMDPSKAIATFGYPSVSADTLIKWQAEWIKSSGRVLNKPTHFEERKGKY
jgi:nucleoside-diphosphate-sugar epimerase